MIHDSDFLTESYRRMVRIRLFELKVAELHGKGEIFGGAHTCIGQEGTVVGALMAVRKSDYMTGTHRSHGHPIGKGAAVEPLIAEIMGRATGICKGKGGSMHLADFSVGSLGESGIVASAMPIATGAGLSAKLRGSGQVCVCFFGDGASNEGAFHESLNMAAVWHLPVIFLCENNGYAITTSIGAATLVPDIASRAAGYGIPGEVVDGQDFFAVYEATCHAVNRARSEDGPTLIEAKTYRYVEHSLGLKLEYRTSEEVEEWRQRDPLELFLQAVTGSKVVTAEAFAQVFDEERERINAAANDARKAPFPAAAAAYDDLYARPFPVDMAKN